MSKIIQIATTPSVLLDTSNSKAVKTPPHLERARLFALTDDGAVYCMALPGAGSDAGKWRRLPSLENDHPTLIKAGPDDSNPPA